MTDRPLTAEELIAITGQKRPSAQIKVLVRDGVPFRPVAGKPVVLVSSLAPVAYSEAKPRVRRL